MTAPGKAGKTSKPSAGGKWWAVTQLAVRAGKPIISYVQADSAAAAAAAVGPGAKVLGGPYATEAEAEKAFPQGSHGTTAVPKSEGPPTVKAEPGDPLGGLTNPLDALGVIAHWIGRITVALTDKYMWISLGWLSLGLLLIALAIYVLVRTSGPYEKAEHAIIGAVKAAA